MENEKESNSKLAETVAPRQVEKQQQTQPDTHGELKKQADQAEKNIEGEDEKTS